MKNDFEINADHWESCFLHMHFYVICLADGRRVWTKFVCLWNTNVLKNNKTVFWYNKKAGQGKLASPGEECYSTECIYMHITIKYRSLIQYLKLRQALNLPSIYVKKSIYIKALCCILFHLPKEQNSLLFKIHSFNPILVLWEEFFPGWSSLLLPENLCQMK